MHAFQCPPARQTYLERFAIGAAQLPTVFVLDAPNEVFWQPAHLAGGAVGPTQVLSTARPRGTQTYIR